MMVVLISFGVGDDDDDDVEVCLCCLSQSSLVSCGGGPRLCLCFWCLSTFNDSMFKLQLRSMVMSHFNFSVQR